MSLASVVIQTPEYFGELQTNIILFSLTISGGYMLHKGRPEWSFRIILRFGISPIKYKNVMEQHKHCKSKWLRNDIMRRKLCFFRFIFLQLSSNSPLKMQTIPQPCPHERLIASRCHTRRSCTHVSRERKEYSIDIPISLDWLLAQFYSNFLNVSDTDILLYIASPLTFHRVSQRCTVSERHLGPSSHLLHSNSIGSRVTLERRYTLRPLSPCSCSGTPSKMSPKLWKKRMDANHRPATFAVFDLLDLKGGARRIGSKWIPTKIL